MVTFYLDVDRSNGSLTYYQVLPVEWDSFVDGPKILRLIGPRSADDDNEQERFDFIAFQYDLLDAVNTVNGALSTRHIVPPFSAHALLIGDRVVRTFDGMTYSHSNCRDRSDVKK